MDDEQVLLERARRLDEDALGQIFDSYYSPIYRYIYFHTGHTETAEDLSAQVFLRLLEALRSDTAPNRYLKAWLFRVASNLMVDEARRGQHRDHLALNEDFQALGAALEDSVQQSMLVARLHDALNELTILQRSVIILRYLMEMTNEETADILQMTVGAVKAQLHRAIAALQRQFEEEMKHESA